MGAPSPETFVDLHFPFCGLDVSVSFDTQTERPLPYNLTGQTTAVGINVRAYEPATDRMRGASRAGYVKFKATQPAGLASMIQELNYVVDPQEAALGTITSTGPIVNPQVPPNPFIGYVPQGGDGFGINRNVGGLFSPAPPPPPTAANWSAGVQESTDIGPPPIGLFQIVMAGAEVTSENPSQGTILSEDLGAVAVIYDDGGGVKYWIVGPVWDDT